MAFWNKWFEPKPFHSGYLPESEGHNVYFAEFGNPNGKPILVFHGGPGGGAKPKHAAFADLKRFRVILFDQRGCGKSLPLGELQHNNTQALLKDAQRLLDYLHIDEQIIIRGGSWGSTLALLFAEQHPQKVKKLLLSQIFLADENHFAWELGGQKHIYPEFVAQMEQKAGMKKIIDYFVAQINSNKPCKQLEAINMYGYYERVCGTNYPHWDTQTLVDEKELASQRIYMNYVAERFMLKNNEILQNIAKIAHIPAKIVHNRWDFVCPMSGAYLLHKAMPRSELVVVADSGHVSHLLHKTMKKEFTKELLE